MHLHLQMLRTSSIKLCPVNGVRSDASSYRITPRAQTSAAARGRYLRAHACGCECSARCGARGACGGRKRGQAELERGWDGTTERGGENGEAGRGGRQQWRASPVFSLYGRFSHSSGDRYNGVPKNVVSMTVSALFTRPTPKSPTCRLSYGARGRSMPTAQAGGAGRRSRPTDKNRRAGGSAEARRMERTTARRIAPTDA